MDNEIRELVLSGGGEHLRSLLLTQVHIDIYNLVKSGTVSKATELARHNKTTAQNASQQLVRLYKAGYIKRIEDRSNRNTLAYIYFVDSHDEKEKRIHQAIRDAFLCWSWF